MDKRIKGLKQIAHEIQLEKARIALSRAVMLSHRLKGERNRLARVPFSLA